MNRKTGNGAKLATQNQPDSIFGNLWASWRAWIDRINARINAHPMPRHHRLGSWQHIKHK